MTLTFQSILDLDEITSTAEETKFEQTFLQLEDEEIFLMRNLNFEEHLVRKTDSIKE